MTYQLEGLASLESVLALCHKFKVKRLMIGTTTIEFADDAFLPPDPPPQVRDVDMTADEKELAR